MQADIHSIITGDATYKTNVGSPTVEPYQLYYINPPERPTFPEVVWGPMTGDFNAEVADFLSEWLSVPFMVWAKTNVYNTIAERIIWLLNHKTNSAGFTAIVQGRSQETYNEDMDVYGVRILFDIHYGRPMI